MSLKKGHTPALEEGHIENRCKGVHWLEEERFKDQLLFKLFLRLWKFYRKRDTTNVNTSCSADLLIRVCYNHSEWLSTKRVLPKPVTWPFMLHSSANMLPHSVSSGAYNDVSYHEILYPAQSATQRWLHRLPPAPEPPACSGWCPSWWRSSSRWPWLQDQGSWTKRLTCRCGKLPPQTQLRRLRRSGHTRLKQVGWLWWRRIFAFFKKKSLWWNYIIINWFIEIFILFSCLYLFYRMNEFISFWNHFLQYIFFIRSLLDLWEIDGYVKGSITYNKYSNMLVNSQI